MRFISFAAGQRERFGIVVADGVIDLTNRLPEIKTLAELMDQDIKPSVESFASGTTDFLLADIKFLPPVPHPSKIICIGLNYNDHRLEAGRAQTDYPTIFLRLADSQIGHGEAIFRPRVSTQLDFEGEIAVYIGKGGGHIEEARAMDHVFGYSCYNDASVRDWQFHTSQYSPGKNFRRTGAAGPWIVTSDEIGDWTKLTLETRLNGVVMQTGAASDLIFSIPKLIAYCSLWTDLSPGDIIVTGTPAGVGLKRTPPLFMVAGDQIEVEVRGIGTLSNVVVDELIG